MSLFTKRFKFKNLHFGTDIHSHLLPGVDDGFKTQSASEEAIQKLHALGFDNFVFTPHIYPELYPENSPASIREKFAAMQPAMEAAGVQCKIAGEHMVTENFEAWLKENQASLLTMPNGEILIEMSYASISPNIKDAIFYLNSLGIRPILAHPERYLFYSMDLRDIKVLSEMDCKLQLNLFSLCGYYGKRVQAKAEAILDSGLYTYAGTDLHSLAQIEVFSNLTVTRKQLRHIENIIGNNSSMFANL